MSRDGEAGRRFRRFGARHRASLPGRLPIGPISVTPGGQSSETILATRTALTGRDWLGATCPTRCRSGCPSSRSEGESVCASAKLDSYHRIDTRRACWHLAVHHRGRVVADTTRPLQPPQGPAPPTGGSRWRMSARSVVTAAERTETNMVLGESGFARRADLDESARGRIAIDWSSFAPRRRRATRTDSCADER